MKKYLLLSLISFVIATSCTFQPNNADGIILQKITNDTVTLSIIDSYYIIKKYKIREIRDTLFIEISSIYSTDDSNIIKRILVPVSSNIKYIKLQNDKMFNVDSIPKYPY